MIEMLLLLVGIALFLGGIYTGIWIQRHSYNDREVPKIITTERLVEVEKPIVVQVPRPAAGSSGGALPIMGIKAKHDVLNPSERAGAEHMAGLISDLPE